MAANEKRCTKCGKLKPISEFYKKSKDKGGYEAQCKACKLAYQKQRHIATMKDPNLHHKRLLTQLKYRKRYGYKIAEKERLERRKNGIPPQRYVNKDLLLELYARGLPIDVIAEKCNCVPATVKLYAYRNGVRRGRGKKKICNNCVEYPCFVGIENMSSNLALTCPKYRIK